MFSGEALVPLVTTERLNIRHNKEFNYFGTLRLSNLSRDHISTTVVQHNFCSRWTALDLL